QILGLSASQCTQETTIPLSRDIQREKIIYETIDLKKTSLRANVVNHISRLMDLQISTGYVSSNLALPQNDNNVFGILPSGLLGFADTTSGGYGFLTPRQATLISAGQRIERFTGGLNLTFRPSSFLTIRG